MDIFLFLRMSLQALYRENIFEYTKASDSRLFLMIVMNVNDVFQYIFDL